MTSPTQPHGLGAISTNQGTRADTSSGGRPKHPKWLRVKLINNPKIHSTRAIMREHGLNTVCEEAACPNLSNCWSQRHATFLIMGDICTRACAFCNIDTGRPRALDPEEPERVARAVIKLGLRHVVITSVDRDDLGDGGARHFARVIEAIRKQALTTDSEESVTTIEVLTPDFRHKESALETVLLEKPDVFNHNLETVPSLYPAIRPGARYFHSLRLLQRAKEIDPGIFTKSGLMLGLGETRNEVLQVMDDLISANVDFLTLGQYLQPTNKHAKVRHFVPPESFDRLRQVALAKGFLHVASSPLTRSSYHADEEFMKLQAARHGLGR